MSVRMKTAVTHHWVILTVTELCRVVLAEAMFGGLSQPVTAEHVQR